MSSAEIQGLKAKRLVRFGLFTLDLRSRELKKSGRKIKIQGQPLEILCALVQTRGQLVSRAELQKRLWSNDTFVDFEHGLNKAVSRIRGLLGDSAENPRFVETVPGEGYRFIAPAEWIADAEGNQPVTDPAVDNTSNANLLRSWWDWKKSILVVAGLLATISIIGAYAYRSRSATPIVETKVTTRTPDLPVEISSISPDGKYVAFSDAEGLWLQLTGKTEVHKLETSERASITKISWFPDSTAILISATNKSAQVSTLWKLSLFGEEPRRFRDDAGQGTPSPDGAKIAFTSGDSGQIWTISSEGEGAQKIAAAHDGEDFGGFVWAEDGRSLIYTRRRLDKNDYQVYLEWMDLASQKNVVLLKEPGLQAFCGTGDGTIFFSRLESATNTNDTNIWKFRVDMQTGKVVENSTRVTNWSGFSLSSLSITRDSKLLSLDKGMSHIATYVIDLDSDARDELMPLTFHDRDDYPGAWDAMGRNIYLDSNRGGVWAIYKQDVTRHTAGYFVGSTHSTKSPTLTPDGRWILYQVIPGATRSWSTTAKLLRIPVAGGPPQDVWQGQGYYTVQCARRRGGRCVVSAQSPDGKNLVASELDPFTGKGRELASIPTNATLAMVRFSWALSPDGTEIALAQPGDTDTDIEIISLTGSGNRRLTVKGWRGFQTLSWVADGSGFFLLMESANGSTILRVERDGAAHVMLKRNRQINFCLPSPDGKWLAFAEYDSTTNVSVLSGF